MDKTFAYHKPGASGLEKTIALRTEFSNLKAKIEELAPSTRERSIALTELETSAMWAIKAVVANDPESVVDTSQSPAVAA
jgi:hypothetical protein